MGTHCFKAKSQPSRNTLKGDKQLSSTSKLRQTTQNGEEDPSFDLVNDRQFWAQVAGSDLGYQVGQPCTQVYDCNNQLKRKLLRLIDKKNSSGNDDPPASNGKEDEKSAGLLGLLRVQVRKSSQEEEAGAMLS